MATKKTNHGPDGRWTKGNTGNPKGRPKGHVPIAQILSKARHKRIIEKLASMAEAGDVPAARELLSRIEPAIKVHALAEGDVRAMVEAILSDLMRLIPEKLRGEALEIVERRLNAPHQAAGPNPTLN